MAFPGFELKDKVMLITGFRQKVLVEGLPSLLHRWERKSS